MSKKSDAAFIANISSVVAKRQVETQVSMDKAISECQSLGEIQELVASLIEKHGKSARIDFDAGHNNICENIVVMREETNEEVNRRIDKEIESLLAKQKNANKQADALGDQVAGLRAAKI